MIVPISKVIITIIVKGRRQRGYIAGSRWKWTILSESERSDEGSKQRKVDRLRTQQADGQNPKVGGLIRGIRGAIFHSQYCSKKEFVNSKL